MSAPRSSPHGVVERQGGDMIPRRRPYAPYDNRRSRNLVWTSKEYQSSHGSECGYGVQRKNGPYDPRGGCRWREPKCRDCVCKFWKLGKCNRGDQCRFLHSWTSFPGLALVASLDGHDKDVKGISLPLGTDKLYSVSSDGEVRVWDCHSGQCLNTNKLQSEAGSLTSHGPWLFLGLKNAVRAFNVQTSQDLHLSGVVLGQVNAMTVGYGLLLAGTSSGTISVWKGNDTGSDPFTYLTSLEGHSGEVTCLKVGGDALYSGSVDGTIKGWDLKTLKCTMTMTQHTDTVTSLLCWDAYLLSSSLDGAINVWARTEEDRCLEVVYTSRQGQSVHALSGMTVAECKHLLFCSLQDGTIPIFDLPSFAERGKIFSTNTVATFSLGPQNMFFSGDKSGNLRVWNFGG